MKPILYSRSMEARTAFVEASFAQLRSERREVGKMIYLAPKKFVADVQRRVPVARCIIAYEDIAKNNDIFNLADDETLLVFDRPARYKHITTDTWVRLSRASERYRRKILVDIVPFTAGVQYLYCPLALIDRAILGYQHWYSFRENNSEQLPDGTTVRAHDSTLLARKLAPWAQIDYADFLSGSMQVVQCPLDPDEKREYQRLRDRLFREQQTASSIVTRLADWTNIRPSRYTRLQALLEQYLLKRVVVYTNLAGHNRRLKKMFPGIEVKSFYDANGGEDQYDLVILFELPITKSYLFLDVIANVRQGCEVLFFRSDTTVDTLLYHHMSNEYSSVNEFARALYQEVQR